MLLTHDRHSGAAGDRRVLGDFLAVHVDVELAVEHQARPLQGRGEGDGGLTRLQLDMHGAAGGGGDGDDAGRVDAHAGEVVQLLGELGLFGGNDGALFGHGRIEFFWHSGLLGGLEQALRMIPPLGTVVKQTVDVTYNP